MTQLQLAQRMGVTKSVVSFYELQERTPSPDILVKLSGIFKVSTDYLLGLDPRETIDISGLSREDIAGVRGTGGKSTPKEFIQSRRIIDLS